MTTAPTPDPLPCPFCGGPASAHEVNPKEAPGWVHLTVEHAPDCFYRVPKETLLLSAFDLERWNHRAELEARKPLPPTDMTVAQHVNALVGDGLTAQKVEAICEREPYDVTGVVLSLPDGRACIVNRSAVRWFHGPRDFWNVLHPDSKPLPLSDEQLRAEFIPWAEIQYRHEDEFSKRDFKICLAAWSAGRRITGGSS